ncbi:ribonuclease E/G [Leptolyngbya sp. BL0902]|uniref:Rne/Rng family ribonuclease n=1 Tax=Leptolyngbya sp. BL0902 TaxID=1115757 RepID=UPI0018E78DF2|nr:Rne/Rng family ribonuclease [Leptolyngbya sp. BL0902]QQE66376.1 ribonuclease E/G [Leptolyngbya sp. BL0902]
MPKQIVIAEQHRIAAVFSEDQIQELIVATGSHQVSDIYLGTVENVLPGIDAAFVNIGDSERNGFMHVTDLGPLRLKRMAGSITELVAPQQKVLVQIMKEPTGNKGPRLTGNISLPGRYLVLMPYGKGVNLSRRIRSENERNRLRALAILIKPAGMGLLVRTEADGISENAIIEDLETLQKQWESIQQQALSTRPPALLNRDDDFVQRVLRDTYNSDVNRIVTDSSSGLKRVKQHLSSWSDGQLPGGVLIDQHRERISILEYFRVNAAIREALKPRVDLPSGGYIIIEPTEALTVVDVNSGSFTRSATARETVLWTNCEAATEIARQLRLRNIAGVIIVDFIDMDSRRDKLQVLEHFSKALRSDKARPQISQLSELGLVELTRKRQGQNIYELFGRPCPTCSGLGHLVHLPGAHPTEDEPVLSPVISSYPSARSESSWTPALRESQLDGLGTQSDLQELDLINHPSYQDKLNKGNRRRRRREPLPGRSTGKEAPIPRETLPSAPKDLPSPVADFAPIADSSAEEEKPAARTSRSRSGGRHDKKPTAPPQVVTVEMTSDEQRIYAMMGISPLVLATNETILDPRNVTIAVRAPGESAAANPTPILGAVAAPQDEAPVVAAVPEPVATDVPVETDKPPAPSKVPIKMQRTPEVAPVPSPDAEPVIAPEEKPSPEVEATENGDASAEGSTVRRRRRRRPSANSSGADD